MVIDAGGGDVRVAKPLLHLRNVGLVVKRVGRCSRSQRMRADFKSELRGIGPHQLINTVRRDRLVERASCVVAKGPKQRAGVVGPVASPSR